MAAYKSKLYKAMSYLRLSKEDGDKEESNSIANQRQLVRDFVNRQDDIELVGEFYDDGYTGTNFERPQFMEMMNAIKRGEADCIIVKDLSRFGRDYIDSGKYIQKVFPMLGIRFIAINDNVDSIRADQSDDLVIPFKNLINDSYCRDLSMKLRGQFRVQRKNGEYVGSYVSYGYLKSEDDRHKLIIDDYAAEIVREIFKRKLQGYSQQKIADHLNGLGVLPPAEYKRQCGLNYKSGFQLKSKSIWTPVTITRILKNRIYIGCLEQGKRGRPNYKVKKMLDKEPQEWIVVEDNHEPIIEKEVFQAVERSMLRDTKVSKKGTVYPLSGVLYCGDCQCQMVIRTVKRGNRKFYYYVCNTNKRGNGCSSHSFSMESLEKAVLKAINVHIQLITELKTVADEIGEGKLRLYRMRKYDTLIESKRKEVEENQEYRLRLYESMVDGIINHDEYVKLRQRYTRRIEDAKEVIGQLNKELQKISEGFSERNSWMDSFLRYHEITKLTRDIVLTVIDKIYIYEDKRFEIIFNFKDEIESLKTFVAQAMEEAG